MTEGEVWEPLDVGAEGEYYPQEGDDVRLVEFIPVILVGDEVVVCDTRMASYGNAYCDGFGECWESSTLVVTLNRNIFI